MTSRTGLPNEYTKLVFADGSNRDAALVRRSGKMVSEGMLRAATMQEWGFHEVKLGPETNGRGTGYLVISGGPGDILYLKTQLRQITLPGKRGEPRSAFNGLWEVSGATGKFNGLQGAGTLRINRLSESERQWVLEGKLSEPQLELPIESMRARPISWSTGKQENSIAIFHVWYMGIGPPK
ncbi:hypothetical protein FVF58_02700 [Paraburkholderia panacisoli]|uniref:Uncharacterized protein n=1 Tax=Paraburkholderia panacisoli TaxID=2603818 RepID=A0A5B0HIC4_9BURK|nr:hypothetical protein [Paraburkholderia panacisoli]KAA1014858.1 hypothetical protein FVF58_02700 [Paraburkholderia panacisoli]